MSVIDTLITDRKQADVDARNDKGTYSAIDMNRVGAAMNYLAARLREQGYAPHISPKTNWIDDEWVSPTDADKYLADLEEIRSQFALYDGAPTIPPDMERFTWKEANDIERILQDIDALLTNIEAGWYYSGDLYAGEI